MNKNNPNNQKPTARQIARREGKYLFSVKISGMHLTKAQVAAKEMADYLGGSLEINGTISDQEAESLYQWILGHLERTKDERAEFIDSLKGDGDGGNRQKVTGSSDRR